MLGLDFFLYIYLYFLRSFEYFAYNFCDIYTHTGIGNWSCSLSTSWSRWKSRAPHFVAILLARTHTKRAQQILSFSFSCALVGRRMQNVSQATLPYICEHINTRYSIPCRIREHMCALSDLIARVRSTFLPGLCLCVGNSYIIIFRRAIQTHENVVILQSARLCLTTRSEYLLGCDAMIVNKCAHVCVG